MRVANGDPGNRRRRNCSASASERGWLWISTPIIARIKRPSLPGSKQSGTIDGEGAQGSASQGSASSSPRSRVLVIRRRPDWRPSPELTTKGVYGTLIAHRGLGRASECVLPMQNCKRSLYVGLLTLPAD